jgi:hypothetical protein
MSSPGNELLVRRLAINMASERVDEGSASEIGLLSERNISFLMKGCSQGAFLSELCSAIYGLTRPGFPQNPKIIKPSHESRRIQLS